MHKFHLIFYLFISFARIFNYNQRLKNVLSKFNFDENIIIWINIFIY